MMVGKIKWDANRECWYCANCRVRQPSLRETCIFCDDYFKNFEEEKIRVEQEKIREEGKKE